MIMICQRCGDDTWGTRGLATFYGEKIAQLCPDCSSEVSLLMMQSPEWNDVMKLDAKKLQMELTAQAGTGPAEIHTDTLCQEINKSKIAVHLLVVNLVKPLADNKAVSLTDKTIEAELKQ